MTFPKENPNSHFRAISWSESRNGSWAHKLGQPVTVDFSVSGNKVKGWVYSIDNTSEDREGVFINRYTISVITERGEILEHISILNGSNVTLNHNHVEFIEI